jgi:nucleotide-binding universal stress UspA family protein
MTLKSILVATDFSEPARAALEHGKALARSQDATLHVLHVVQQIPTYYGSEVGLAVADIEDTIAASAQRQLESAIGNDGDVVVRASTTRAPKVARAINEYAEEHDVDLIVVGTHGRGAVSRFLMGSVAERVVRSASRPVLTIHAPEGDSPLIDHDVVAHETAEGVPV